ncbi:hypothetical protein ABT381_35305 [Streptomyces sp. NPDC000151]|uniref:hypothetical protein n=1 Tax=Streptomyces sp. NPDC000151 TaxID=3154244 RepID=UPI00332E5825
MAEAVFRARVEEAGYGLERSARQFRPEWFERDLLTVVRAELAGRETHDEKAGTSP